MLQLSVAVPRGRRLAPALAVLLAGVASAWSGVAAPGAGPATLVASAAAPVAGAAAPTASVAVLVARATAPAATSGASKSTTTGDFWVEPPTLQSLGFEWRIKGDDNRNATVAVSYRKKGDPSWRKALPLLRLQRESVIGGLPRDGGNEHFNKYIAPNMFAGSILNLDPDTEYEARFVLSDPDGVKGAKEHNVTVRTRKEPVPAAGGAVYNVYPFDYTGPRQEPAFTGLMAAYYMASAHFDYENAFPPRVQPGDTILVHAGLYVGDQSLIQQYDDQHDMDLGAIIAIFEAVSDSFRIINR